jgi:hypothetical protein
MHMCVKSLHTQQGMKLHCTSLVQSRLASGGIHKRCAIQYDATTNLLIDCVIYIRRHKHIPYLRIIDNK